MKLTNLLKILFLTILLVGLQSCKQDNDEDGVINDIDDCPETPAGTIVDKNGCPLVKEIGDVHF